MVEVRISQHRVRRYLELIADAVGYRVDDADWDAISFGLREPLEQGVRPYHYPIEGTSRIDVVAAPVPDSDLVGMRIEAEPRVEQRVRAISVYDDQQIV